MMFSSKTWLFRTFIFVSVLYLGLLVVVHFTASSVMPNGKFVEIDKRWVHYYCRGKGDTVVLFETAFGEDSRQSWHNISQQLSQRTRTCYYDRLGMGWSGHQPADFDTAQKVGILSRIVDEVAEQAPVILVGHSYGGILTRQYALQHPERVRGLVLIDSDHESADERVNALLPSISVSEARISRFTAMIGLSKIYHWFATAGDKGSYAQRVAMQQASIEYADAKLNYVRERENMPAIPARQYPLGDIPLLVLEHDPAAYPDDADWQSTNALWHELQQQLVSLSERASLIRVEGSMANIPSQNPAAVVSAVESLLIPADA